MKQLRKFKIFSVLLIAIMAIGMYSQGSIVPSVTADTDLQDVSLPDFFLKSNVTIYIPEDTGSDVAFMNPDLTYRWMADGRLAITGWTEAKADELTPELIAHANEESQEEESENPDEEYLTQNGEFSISKLAGEKTYLNKTLGLVDEDYSTNDFLYEYPSSTNVSTNPFLSMEGMRSLSTDSNTIIKLTYANDTGTGAGVWDNKTKTVNIYDDFNVDAVDRWFDLTEYVTNQTHFNGVNITISNVQMDNFKIFRTEAPITDARYAGFYFGSESSKTRGVTGSFVPEMEYFEASHEELLSPNGDVDPNAGSDWFDDITPSKILATSGLGMDTDFVENQRTFGWASAKELEKDVLEGICQKAGLTVEEDYTGLPCDIDDYVAHEAKTQNNYAQAFGSYISDLHDKEATDTRSVDNVVSNAKDKSLRSMSLSIGEWNAKEMTDILEGNAVDQDISVDMGSAIHASVVHSEGGANKLEMSIVTYDDTTNKATDEITGNDGTDFLDTVGQFQQNMVMQFTGQADLINEKLGAEEGSTTGMFVLFMILLLIVVTAYLAYKFMRRKMGSIEEM